MAIQLDPGAGGRSIDTRALHMGDIVVSTIKKSVISAGIRAATSSPVSHSILYIGNEQAIEAIADGIVLRSLAQAIGDATLAVAYRYPEISEVQALKIRDFGGWQLGKKYNYAGIGRHAFCVIRGSIACQRDSRQVVMKRDEFFCSQLVFAAFKSVGIPLSETEPNWSTPGDIPKLALTKALNYVGHLKA
jgi:uncharacterized protein YycO